MSLNATTEPTGYGAIGPSGNDSWNPRIVYSYLVASAQNISKGDFLKLASSTSNTVTKCTSSSDDTSFVGVAFGDLDNSSGTTASDTTLSVLREGIAIVDILVASASGTQKATVNFDDLLYLADAETGQTSVTGQALTGTANGQPVGRSIDRITIPSATALYRGRVYFNTLLKPTFVE